MYPPASGFAHIPPTDHVKQIAVLADHLRDRLNASHVFLAGLSNGCAMSLRLGLEAPAGVIDAVSCTSHAMHADIRTPQPAVPRPLLLLTGTEDPIFASHEDVNRTLYEWARNNGCTGAPAIRTGEVDTTVTEFACHGAPVRHVAFQGAEHIVPLQRSGPLQCSFFEEHTH